MMSWIDGWVLFLGREFDTQTFFFSVMLAILVGLWIYFAIMSLFCQKDVISPTKEQENSDRRFRIGVASVFLVLPIFVFGYLMYFMVALGLSYSDTTQIVKWSDIIAQASKLKLTAYERKVVGKDLQGTYAIEKKSLFQGSQYYHINDFAVSTYKKYSGEYVPVK